MTSPYATENSKDENFLSIAPYRAELVGQRPPAVVMGKNSGIDNVGAWLKKLGLEANEDQRQAMVNKVKEVALEKKGLLDEEEFRGIYEEVVQD